jgi:hypothetical protein
MQFNFFRAVQQALQSPVWRTVTLTPYATGLAPLSDLELVVYQSLRVVPVSSKVDCVNLIQCHFHNCVVQDREKKLLEIICEVASYVDEHSAWFASAGAYQSLRLTAHKVATRSCDPPVLHAEAESHVSIPQVSSWKSGFVLKSDFDDVVADVKQYFKTHVMPGIDNPRMVDVLFQFVCDMLSRPYFESVHINALQTCEIILSLVRSVKSQGFWNIYLITKWFLKAAAPYLATKSDNEDPR